MGTSGRDRQEDNNKEVVSEGRAQRWIYVAAGKELVYTGCVPNIVRMGPITGAAGFKSGGIGKKSHLHAVCVDEVKERLNEATDVTEVMIARVFPEGMMAVKVAHPDHMIVVVGRGEGGVRGKSSGRAVCCCGLDHFIC